MNRVLNAIAATKKQIASRLADGLVTQAKVDALHKELDMPIDQYVKFQELKSVASMDGTLTLDEAQTIYGFLGNTPDHFNKQPIEVKSILNKILEELLQKRIGKKRSA